MGILCVLALAAAVPAPYAIQFEGPSVSAEVDSQVAILRAGDRVAVGSGSAFLRGQDRAKSEKLLYGDSGELWVRARVGADVYRIELDAVGFPPEEALPKAKRGWLGRAPSVPPAPEQPIEGGVILERSLNGRAPRGLKSIPNRRATMAVWGVGRVYKNDELVAPRARIFAEVLPSGVVNSEGQLMQLGKSDDPELDVFVDHVPNGLGEGTSFHFALEGPSVLVPKEAQARAPQKAPAYGGSGRAGRRDDLSRRPTVDEMWESGAPMLSWRAVERPVAAPPVEPGYRTEGEGAAPGYGEAAAPPAAPEAAPSEYLAPAPGQSAYGAPQAPLPQTVAPSALQPIEHPIEYTYPTTPYPPGTAPGMTGYAPPSVGYGGAIGSVGGRTPTTAPGTGIFSNPPQQPSGFFAPPPPPPPLPGSSIPTVPAAPLIGEPAQPISTPTPLNTLPNAPAPVATPAAPTTTPALAPPLPALPVPVAPTTAPNVPPTTPPPPVTTVPSTTAPPTMVPSTTPTPGTPATPSTPGTTAPSY